MIKLAELWNIKANASNRRIINTAFWTTRYVAIQGYKQPSTRNLSREYIWTRHITSQTTDHTTRQTSVLYLEFIIPPLYSYPSLLIHLIPIRPPMTHSIHCPNPLVESTLITLERDKNKRKAPSHTGCRTSNDVENAMAKVMQRNAMWCHTIPHHMMPCQ